MLLVFAVMSLRDEDVLSQFSTSPLVEPIEFVPDIRATLAWLAANPRHDVVFKRGPVCALNE